MKWPEHLAAGAVEGSPVFATTWTRVPCRAANVVGSPPLAGPTITGPRRRRLPKPPAGQRDLVRAVEAAALISAIKTKGQQPQHFRRPDCGRSARR